MLRLQSTVFQAPCYKRIVNKLFRGDTCVTDYHYSIDGGNYSDVLFILLNTNLYRRVPLLYIHHDFYS